MADPAFHSCTSCAARLPATDGHSRCLLCLGEGHIVETCRHCQAFKKQTRQQRADHLKFVLWKRALSVVDSSGLDTEKLPSPKETTWAAKPRKKRVAAAATPAAEPPEESAGPSAATKRNRHRATTSAAPLAVSPLTSRPCTPDPGFPLDGSPVAHAADSPASHVRPPRPREPSPQRSAPDAGDTLPPSTTSPGPCFSISPLPAMAHGQDTRGLWGSPCSSSPSWDGSSPWSPASTCLADWSRSPDPPTPAPDRHHHRHPERGHSGSSSRARTPTLCHRQRTRPALPRSWPRADCSCPRSASDPGNRCRAPVRPRRRECTNALASEGSRQHSPLAWHTWAQHAGEAISPHRSRTHPREDGLSHSSSPDAHQQRTMEPDLACLARGAHHQGGPRCPSRSPFQLRQSHSPPSPGGPSVRDRRRSASRESDQSRSPCSAQLLSPASPHCSPDAEPLDQDPTMSPAGRGHFADLVLRMAGHLGLQTSEVPEVDPVFDALSPQRSTPVSIPLLPTLLRTVRQSWKAPAVALSTSRRIESTYKVADKTLSFLHQHPRPNSVTVESMRGTSQSDQSMPVDKERRRLDSLAKKGYAASSLGICVSNYEASMARYQLLLWKEMACMAAHLPDDLRHAARLVHSEAEKLSRYQIEAARHHVDCDGKAMLSAVVIRRHAWMRSANLPQETRSQIEDLPFDGEWLFSAHTNECVDSLHKARTTPKCMGFPPPTPQRRWQGTPSTSSCRPFSDCSLYPKQTAPAKRHGAQQRHRLLPRCQDNRRRQ
ncbi:serine/arginine repetitive matrix protein 1-like [Varanus komodoensis]|uniref:serine/arginine repetitive matrix protein 1-like n=1 Tax=Varanus komodoensis TaxID=61221 RepID=UPI001CF7D430|nr:serine/arginine repetitive matrix protein 1-like [Varanus komodoensis]